MDPVYAIMICNDEYPVPELCFEPRVDDVGLYKTASKAEAFIEYMIAEGFPKDDYFVVEIKKLGE